MPRASLSPTDAVEVKLGIQEGNVEVVGAKVKVHQYPPNKATGRQGPPFLCVQLELARLDEDFNRIADEPTEFNEFGLGRTALDSFHPGLAKSATDDDPEDMGTEIDAEGNVIYVADSAGRLNTKCKWIQHSASLVKQGFKPEVLNTGWTPYLIGVKGHVKTVHGEKFTASDGSEQTPAVLVWDKCLTPFPYEKKAAAAAGKGKTVAITPTSSTAKASAPDKPRANGAAAEPTSADPESLALEALARIATDPKLQGTPIPRTKLQGETQKYLLRSRSDVPPKDHGKVLAHVKDDQWLMEHGADLGYVIDLDTQTVTVPAAE